MTNKQFVLYNSRTDFDTALSSGEIDRFQIVFIVDTKQIWTQNTFYSCPLTKEEIGQYVQELTNGKANISDLSNVLAEDVGEVVLGVTL